MRLIWPNLDQITFKIIVYVSYAREIMNIGAKRSLHSGEELYMCNFVNVPLVLHINMILVSLDDFIIKIIKVFLHSRRCRHIAELYKILCFSIFFFIYFILVSVSFNLNRDNSLDFHSRPFFKVRYYIRMDSN